MIMDKQEATLEQESTTKHEATMEPWKYKSAKPWRYKMRQVEQDEAMGVEMGNGEAGNGEAEIGDGFWSREQKKPLPSTGKNIGPMGGSMAGSSTSLTPGEAEK